ncbi:endonuclease/exonuclease/phosphatase family protein [Bacteroidota bacterium]
MIFQVQSQPLEFSVMTWNIWHGGTHGAAENDYEQDSSYTINTLKIIQEHDPDILLMQETYCCGMEIARQAGYKYSWRGSSNLSIHSKYPIIDTLKIYKPFNSHGVIIDVDGRDVVCFNIWLHYLPDYMKNSEIQSPEALIEGEKDTRHMEIMTILEEIDTFIRNSDEKPIIMGGDFNSGSHLDWIENTQHLHHGKVVEWPVSSEMYDHGFKDSFREINPDPLTKPAVTNRFLSNQIIADRIDYIYYTGNNLRVIDSKIVKEDPVGGFFNSDHRAVRTRFELIHNR